MSRESADRQGVPGGAISVERMRDLLRIEPSFGVMGLQNPALTPSRLIDVEERSGRVSRVTLGFGEAKTSAGRFAMVISGIPDRPLDDLADLLAGEAQRVGEDVTQDPPMAPELTPAGGLRLNVPLEVDGLIVVESLPVPAHLRRQGRLWAAHITSSPGHVYTVVARGIDPGTLQLSRVTDLRHYVAAWEEYQHKSVAAETFHTRAEAAAAAPAQGLDAHIRLIRTWLAHRPRPAGRGDAPANLHAAEQQRIWDAAVATQMHYSAQPQQDAVNAVSAMLNQALRLADRAAWFVGTAHGLRAIEEMARYTVFDSDVPSRRAQEWWGRVWLLSTTVMPGEPEQARDREREFVATESVWLSAWQRWSEGDTGQRGI